MGKRFRSVSEMAATLSGDSAAKDRLDLQIREQSLAKMLFRLRCAQDVTQEEMAKRMGVTQGKVSKLEHSDWDQIRFGDVAAYTEALGIASSIFFHQKMMEPVDWVKLHATQIREHLDRLGKLAGDDEKLLECVTKFYGQSLMDFVGIVVGAVEKLPDAKKRAARMAEQMVQNVIATNDVLPERTAPRGGAAKGLPPDHESHVGKPPDPEVVVAG